MRLGAARTLVRVALLLLAAAAEAPGQAPESPPPLRDNSFLIEEAYNQEPGIVQHVGTFSVGRVDGWALGFNQEWPLGGMRDQLSIGLGLVDTGNDTRFGDIELGYRRQLVGESESTVLVAPRVSLLWLQAESGPDGHRDGVGGSVGLPVTFVLAPWLVTHWNAGLTVGPLRPIANAGASAVWLVSPTANLLVEGVWAAQEGTRPVYVLNPGARFAINAGTLQVVPGISFPIDLTGREETDAVLLYLSFEHPY
jgi:hypothetical protein